MSQASEVELLMLQLINEERTARGLNPLAINDELNASSEDHSEWMLDNDVFSHTGVGGSNARQRIEAPDYALEGSWRVAENIGWQSERGAPGIADDVEDIHNSLMESPGHRANILNPDLEDIGIGVVLGDFSGYEAVMITQNFGRTDAVDTAPQDDAAPVVTSDAGTQDDPTPPPVTEQEPPIVVTTDDSDTPDVVEAAPEPPLSPAPQDPETEMQPIDVAEDAPEQAMPDGIFDCFDFGMMDGVADDITTGFDFEGTIANSNETRFTTDDPADFEAMIIDIFAGLGGFHLDFG